MSGSTTQYRKHCFCAKLRSVSARWRQWKLKECVDNTVIWNKCLGLAAASMIG